MELTNTGTFCISCHEMEANVHRAYRATVPCPNRTGVRACCPDRTCRFPGFTRSSASSGGPSSFGITSAGRSTRRASSRRSTHSSPRTSGTRCTPRTRGRAATAPISVTWTWRCRSSGQRTAIRRPRSRARPASTATVGSPIACRRVGWTWTSSGWPGNGAARPGGPRPRLLPRKSASGARPGPPSPGPGAGARRRGVRGSTGIGKSPTGIDSRPSSPGPGLSSGASRARSCGPSFGPSRSHGPPRVARGLLAPGFEPPGRPSALRAAGDSGAAGKARSR